jgi:twitching motility protein PilT
VEVLLNTGRVYERILDPERTSSLAEVIAEGSYDGMQTFDQALLELVAERLVSEEDALVVATNPHDFSLALGALGPDHRPDADELVGQAARADG